jgi:hypothetical protein
VRIGTSLTLIAVGLILAYAVDFDLPGIKVQTLGGILFWVGALGLAISIGIEVAEDRRRRGPRPQRRPSPPPEHRDLAPRRPVARKPYDPVVRPRPPPRDPDDEPTRVLPDSERDRRRRGR